MWDCNLEKTRSTLVQSRIDNPEEEFREIGKLRDMRKSLTTLSEQLCQNTTLTHQQQLQIDQLTSKPT